MFLAQLYEEVLHGSSSASVDLKLFQLFRVAAHASNHGNPAFIRIHERSNQLAHLHQVRLQATEVDIPSSSYRSFSRRLIFPSIKL